MKRVYSRVIKEHFALNRQMLFLMGPRQAGKTTTCQGLKKEYVSFFYFSWDNYQDRQLILQGPRALAEVIGLSTLKRSVPLVVFDEIHKFSDWKNYLKGLYDTYPNQLHILVTGSARLDIYKKGGDSLMGRYFMYRFHPLTVAEIVNPVPREKEIMTTPKKLGMKRFEALLKYGCYPDPFIKASTRFFNRWRHLRFQQLFQDEVRDVTRVQEIALLELLAKLLKERVGMQTTYESLAKSLRVSNVTVRKWTQILHSLYYCFEVRPWSRNIARALIKEPKYYLWDWSEIEDPCAQAENFVACHLLKAVHFWTDHGLGLYDLHYIRDKEKREVDFL